MIIGGEQYNLLIFWAGSHKKWLPLIIAATAELHFEAALLYQNFSFTIIYMIVIYMHFGSDVQYTVMIGL